MWTAVDVGMVVGEELYVGEHGFVCYRGSEFVVSVGGSVESVRHGGAGILVDGFHFLLLADALDDMPYGATLDRSPDFHLDAAVFFSGLRNIMPTNQRQSDMSRLWLRFRVVEGADGRASLQTILDRVV